MKQVTRRLGLIVFLLVFVWAMQFSANAEPGYLGGDNGIGAAGASMRSFSDVPSGHPNALYISYLAQEGLLAGFPDGTFRPQAGLTRAQAAVLIARTAGLAGEGGAQQFSDVDPGYWAADSIMAAAAAGLLKGYPDGTFRPDGVLTRAEGIALLLRLSGQSDSGAALPELEDISAAHWAAGSAAEGIAAGMIGLSADQKRFLPDAPFIRGDLARALGVLVTKDPDMYEISLAGKVKDVTGTVDIVEDGQVVSQAKNDTFVVPGQTIKTGSASAVEIVFPDGTGLLLKERSELAIEEAKGRSYIKENGMPGTAVEWLNLDLKQGKMFGALASRYEISGKGETKTGWVVSAVYRDDYPVLASLDSDAIVTGFNWSFFKKKDTAKPVQRVEDTGLPWYQTAHTKRVKVKVDMPWGVAAIRGTFWENIVSADGRSKTTLLTGDGEVTSGGKTVTLAPGQSTEIKGSEVPPAQPAPMSTTEMKEWVQVGEWAQERAQDIHTNQETEAPPAPPAEEQPEEEDLPQPEVETLTEPSQPQQEQESIEGIVDTISKAIQKAENDVKDSSTSGDGGGGGHSSLLPALNITGVVETIELDPVTESAYQLMPEAQNVEGTKMEGVVFTYVTNNTNVATIDTSGLVIAAGQGTATITIRATKAGYTDGITQVAVHVLPLPFVGVLLENEMSFLDLALEEMAAIHVNTNPEDAVISVQSSNLEVAAVSIDGKLITVTGAGSGEAVILVTASKSGYESSSAEFTVYVEDCNDTPMPLLELAEGQNAVMELSNECTEITVARGTTVEQLMNGLMVTDENMHMMLVDADYQPVADGNRFVDGTMWLGVEVEYNSIVYYQIFVDSGEGIEVSYNTVPMPGEAVELEIYGVKDINGYELYGEINVNIVSDLDGLLFNQPVMFENGIAVVTIPAGEMNTPGVHQLTVEIADEVLPIVFDWLRLICYPPLLELMEGQEVVLDLNNEYTEITVGYGTTIAELLEAVAAVYGNAVVNVVDENDDPVTDIGTQVDENMWLAVRVVENDFYSITIFYEIIISQPLLRLVQGQDAVILLSNRYTELEVAAGTTAAELMDAIEAVDSNMTVRLVDKEYNEITNGSLLVDETMWIGVETEPGSIEYFQILISG